MVLRRNGLCAYCVLGVFDRLAGVGVSICSAWGASRSEGTGLGWGSLGCVGFLALLGWVGQSCRPVDSSLDPTGAAWCAVLAHSIDLITAGLGAL